MSAAWPLDVGPAPDEAAHARVLYEAAKVVHAESRDAADELVYALASMRADMDRERWVSLRLEVPTLLGARVLGAMALGRLTGCASLDIGSFHPALRDLAAWLLALADVEREGRHRWVKRLPSRGPRRRMTISALAHRAGHGPTFDALPWPA